MFDAPGPDAELTVAVDPEPDPDPDPPLGLAPVPLAVALPEALDPELTTSPVEELVDPLTADEATDEAPDDEEGVDALQDRSYRGLLPKVEPTIPKLGLGVAGEASCRVNLDVVG